MLKCCQLAVFSAFILGLSRIDSKQKDVRHKYLYECWLSRFAYFFVLGWIFSIFNSISKHKNYSSNELDIFFAGFFSSANGISMEFFWVWIFFTVSEYLNQSIFLKVIRDRLMRNFFEFKLKFGQKFCEKKFDQQI